MVPRNVAVTIHIMKDLAATLWHFYRAYHKLICFNVSILDLFKPQVIVQHEHSKLQMFCGNILFMRKYENSSKHSCQNIYFPR